MVDTWIPGKSERCKETESNQKDYFVMCFRYVYKHAGEEDAGSGQGGFL